MNYHKKIPFQHWLLHSIIEQLDKIENQLGELVPFKVWLNLKQASQYSSLSISTLRRAIAQGRLKATKVSGKILIKIEWIDKFLI